jgi:hypothetical protein
MTLRSLLAALLVVVAACGAELSAPATTVPDAAAAPDGDVYDEMVATRPDEAVARTADARSPDRAFDVLPPASDAFFGSSRCPSANTLLCEGFESGTLDTAEWMVRREAAAVEIANDRVARGGDALRINIANTNRNPWNYGWLQTQRAFTVAGSRLFVRAFVYLHPNTPSRHFRVALATSTVPSPTNSAWSYQLNVIPQGNVRGGPNVLRELFYYGPGYDQSRLSRSGTPQGTWACWEWELRGTTNELAFWLNGQPVKDLAITPAMNWLAPRQARLSFGLSTSHVESYGPEGYDAWFDEIAIANQRIGCER